MSRKFTVLQPTGWSIERETTINDFWNLCVRVIYPNHTPIETGWPPVALICKPQSTEKMSVGAC